MDGMNHFSWREMKNDTDDIMTIYDKSYISVTMYRYSTI